MRFFRHSRVVQGTHGRGCRFFLWAGLSVLPAASGQVIPPQPDVLKLEKYVVSGDKLERPLFELSQSIGLLTKSSLENQGATSAFSVLDQLANTYVGIGLDTPISIRGVGIGSVAPAALDRTNSVATLFFNDVASTTAYADYMVPSLWDVEAVSVFRGPLSTSHGANALIGGVFLQYTAPAFDRTGQAEVRYGAFNTYRLGVAQNLPMSADRLAARISFERQHTDGADENITLRRKDWSGSDQEHLRGQLRWRPRGDDALTIDFLARYENSDSAPLATVRSLNGRSVFGRQADADNRERSEAEARLGSVHARWEPDAGDLLESISSYHGLNVRSTFDIDYTAAPLARGTSSIDEHVYAQEVRWRHTDEKWLLLAGAFAQRTDFAGGFNARLAVPGFPATAVNSTGTDISNEALFGQVSFSPVPAVTFEGGLRLHHEDRKTTNLNVVDGSGLVAAGKQDGFADAPEGGVTFHASKTVNLGVTVAKGFRSGGVSTALLLSRAVVYDPEVAWNYELFLRWLGRENTLRLQANAYFMDWRHQQVIITLPGGVPSLDDVTVNAGRSRLHGFELEGAWTPDPHWSAFFSLGHQFTELVDFVAANQNLSGSPFANAPPWNFAVGVSHEMDRGFFSSGTLTWRDHTFTQIGSPDFTHLEARLLLGGRVGYHWRRWTAYVYGENVLNRDFALSRVDRSVIGVRDPVTRVAPPRVVGTGLGRDW
jgi:iron complex outermembrane receptor protein